MTCLYFVIAEELNTLGFLGFAPESTCKRPTLEIHARVTKLLSLRFVSFNLLDQTTTMLRQPCCWCNLSAPWWRFGVKPGHRDRKRFTSNIEISTVELMHSLQEITLSTRVQQRWYWCIIDEEANACALNSCRDLTGNDPELLISPRSHKAAKRTESVQTAGQITEKEQQKKKKKKRV